MNNVSTGANRRVDIKPLHNLCQAFAELQPHCINQQATSTTPQFARSSPAPTPTMLTRTIRMRGLLRVAPTIFRASYASGNSAADTVHQVPANDPHPRPPKQNVSETNAIGTSSEGSFDKVLQESPEKGEERRVMQAPNRKGTWSTSQQSREIAMSGPRFEQTIFEDQVCVNSQLRTLGK